MEPETLQEPFLQAIKASIEESFSTVLSLSPKVSDKDLAITTEELICSISFTGEIEGAIAIDISGVAACKLVSKMLGMDITEVSKDVTDGVGELLNMVAGGVKRQLANTLKAFEISLPTTIKGQDLKVAMSAGVTSTKTGFDCGEFTFTIVAFYRVHKEGETMKAAIKTDGVDAKKMLNDLIKTEGTTEPAEKKNSDEDAFLADVRAAVNSPTPDPAASGQEKKEPVFAEPAGAASEQSAASALNALLKNVEGTAAPSPPAEPGKDAAPKPEGLIAKTKIVELFDALTKNSKEGISRDELLVLLEPLLGPLSEKKPAPPGAPTANAANPPVSDAMKELEDVLKTYKKTA